jgi:hemoglobin
VHDLVVAFYREVVFDDLLAPVFTETAEVDWSVHIPRLIDYWCRVLLGEPGYVGALLASHQHVHDVEPLRPEHFDRWLALWNDCIDQRWAGSNADRAKAHASRIGRVIAGRLGGCPWSPSAPMDRPVPVGTDGTR